MAVGAPAPSARMAAAAAASVLLLAVAACVALRGGTGSIAALSGPAGPAVEAGQAVLERELQATKQKLSHEAGIIAKLKQQESMFRSSLKQGTTSALVMKGGLATGQQLDGEEAEGGEEGADEDDGAREKGELEEREEQHFAARQRALAKALRAEPKMSPAEARQMKWKASKEMYEQAAFKDISGEEHNRTEAEPLADELLAKYEESALKVDGVEGYKALLAEANETDTERMKQWDKYIATQKNRTTFFPMVDKTKGPVPNWPADNPTEAEEAAPEPEEPEEDAGSVKKAVDGQSTLHSEGPLALKDREQVLGQALHAGEHVVAVKPFLPKQGNLLPMKAGETATVLKLNTKTGVDTIITASGEQGKFPDSDLAPEETVDKPVAAKAKEIPQAESGTKAPSYLHLPPAVDGNVVDAAIRDGAHNFAAVLARERERSTEKRAQREHTKKLSQSAKPLLPQPAAAVASPSGQEPKARRENVVAQAIREADSSFSQAKKAELERSMTQRKTHLREQHMAHATESDTQVKQSVSQARPQDLPTAIAEAAAHDQQEDASKILNHEIPDGSSPAIDSAVKAAEETFDRALKKKLSKSVHDGTRVVSHASSDIDAAASKAEKVFDKNLGEQETTAVESQDKTKAKSKLSPAVQAAVAAAEAKFDQKVAKFEKKEKTETSAAVAVAKSSRKELSPAVKAAMADAEAKFDRKFAMQEAHAKGKMQIKAQRPAVATGKEPATAESRRSSKDMDAHSAVQRAVDLHKAAFTEAAAREEARSVEKKMLESKLKMKEAKVEEATATVRALRDKLARDENGGKHSLVAKELAEQGNYIGSGISSEESFSDDALRGEVAHSNQLRLAKGGVTLSVAKADDKSAATQADRQSRAQQLRAHEMQEEEQAAVRSANSIYARHMKPLQGVAESYSKYVNRLKREEDAYSKAEAELRKSE